MADEKPAETTAPVSPSPPAAEPAPAPAPIAVEPAASSPEPVKAAEPAFTPHTDTPTLLEETKIEEPKPAEVKPIETKPEEKPAEKPVEKPPEAKPEEAAPAEAKPAEVPAVEPAPLTYTEFKLPEGIVPDNTRMTEYTSALGKHRIPQEAGQELLDLHTQSLRNYADNLAREQHKAFADTRAGWRKQVMADPELGGAGHQTTMGAIARMRDLFVPENDRKAFDEMMRVTGAGDHPAFLRAWHRAAQFFDEPAIPPPGAQPSPTNGQRPGRRGLRDIYRETSQK